MRYPGWDVIGEPQFRFADMVTALTAQIIETAPAGVLRLIGYSYGGIVAFAVARHLRAAGREIAFLGLLDSNIPLESQQAQPRDRSIRLPTWMFRRDRADNICRVVAKYLLLPRARWISLRLLDPKSSWLDARTRFGLDYWICRLRRTSLAQSWLGDLTEPIDIPARLFRSEQWTADRPPDLGWRSYLSHLDVVMVTGDHFTMLDPPHLSCLTEELVAAVPR